MIINIKDRWKKNLRAEVGKAPEINKVTAEMLIYGGELVIDWRHSVHKLA